MTNPNPIPGLFVTPVTGMVPVGGRVEIKVQFNPASNAKFDTKFDVEVRGGRLIGQRWKVEEFEER